MACSTGMVRKNCWFMTPNCAMETARSDRKGWNGRQAIRRSDGRMRLLTDLAVRSLVGRLREKERR